MTPCHITLLVSPLSPLKPSLWLKAICMCKYCKSIRDDAMWMENVSFAFGYYTNTERERGVERERGHSLQTSNYVEQSCKQILPVMRAANKNKYLHSIWQKRVISLPPTLCLCLALLAKGKLCVKSAGIFVNLKQQEPKPKPKPRTQPNPNRAKQSEASARQNRLPTD